MEDEKQISFPDGGMVASGMSTHPCNKADYHYKVKDLTRQLTEAREELADIKDSYRRVMEEKCPTDEIHCTCVPALRAEIARMRKALLGLYNHTKNDMQIAGLNGAARAALEASDG